MTGLSVGEAAGFAFEKRERRGVLTASAAT
jgi:PIN domain nuclease of toxin-antitoxin system